MTSESTIDYEALAQNAMRGLVRTVLQNTAKSGLPGDHHFYISFDTNAAGVSISKRLREKYANEMTIVLQHRFWDLSVSDDRFEVKLTFDGIPERVVVPFSAIKVFFDPSVRYGLQFEEPEFNADSVDLSVTSLDQNFAEPDHPQKPGAFPAEPATVAHLTTPGAEILEDEPLPGEQPAEEAADAEATEATEDAGEPAGAEIVSLDAFRKK
ncbi:MAG: ClpXP protease specificity-enhancing factor SspB [Filomicrobium sp.]